MSQVRSRDGTTIAYDRLGSGPPLILVDGAFCSRAFGPMPKLAPLLALNFTAFMYDRRGRGQSGDTPPYAVEREIDDLAALVREAGGSVFVYGISSGAGPVRGPVHGRHAGPRASGEPPRAAGAAHRRERRGAAVRFYMKDIIGMPGWLVTVFRLLPMWSKLKAIAPTLAYDSAIMGDFALPAKRAASLKIPTLVISGDKSFPVLREAAQELAKVIPGAELRTLPGQTHNVAAAVLAPVLKEFFVL